MSTKTIIRALSKPKWQHNDALCGSNSKITLFPQRLIKPSPKRSLLRIKFIIIMLIALSSIGRLTNMQCRSNALRLPYSFISRPQLSSSSSSLFFSVHHHKNLRTTHSTISYFSRRNSEGYDISRKRPFVNAPFHISKRQTTPVTTRLYHNEQTPQPQPSSSTTTIEISPSDHGTLPLSSFQSIPQLHPQLAKNLSSHKWNNPTPIQSHAIPLLLRGDDAMISAQTGSGKTLMFGIPLLQRLLVPPSSSSTTMGNPRRSNMAYPSGLIISPTRELAAQTAHVLSQLSHQITTTPSVKIVVCTGGGDDVRKQRRALLSTTPQQHLLIIGTPGRILQYIDEGLLSSQHMQNVVIDEADRMLDLGFEPQLRRISSRFLKQSSSSSQKQRPQAVLCSATFPRDVQRLASEFVSKDYYFVAQGRVGAVKADISQVFHYINDNDGGGFKNQRQGMTKGRQQQQRRQPPSLSSSSKFQTLVDELSTFFQNSSKKKKTNSLVLIFCNTKDETSRLHSTLQSSPSIPYPTHAVHGDMSQSQRSSTLSSFRQSTNKILVATDVAARGLDVTTIGLVVNWNMPRDGDTFVHRVGRTGRGGGGGGKAVSFVDGWRDGMVVGRVVDDLMMSGVVPAWLVGMGYVAKARVLEEEGLIMRGVVGGMVDDGRMDNEEEEEEEGKELFTAQDFRSRAARGSYGVERDTSFEGFDEEAYGDIINDDDSDDDDNDDDYDSILDVGLDKGKNISSNTSFLSADDLSQDTAPMIDDRNDIDDDGIVPIADNKQPTFEQPKPSNQLIQAIKRLTSTKSSSSKDDDHFSTFNPSLYSSLTRNNNNNHRLRYEYLGLFPFDTVKSTLLESLSQQRGLNNNQKDDNEKESSSLQRILIVTEKPSIAKAFAEALATAGSSGRIRQRRGISRALPVYEVTTDIIRLPISKGDDDDDDDENKNRHRCIVTVTSVVGHVFSLGFATPSSSSDDDDDQQQQQQRPLDPLSYFHLPVIKREEQSTSKLRIVDHLRTLASLSHYLILALDCDAEGENIAHEVISLTRKSLLGHNNNNAANPPTPIFRARFSSIAPQSLRTALQSLTYPDASLSRSVDARQELDLRVGVALTRFLTWKCVGVAKRRFDSSTRLVSYGPCQTPALRLCVDRAFEILGFEGEDYWMVELRTRGDDSGGKIRWKLGESDAVVDTRRKKIRQNDNDDSNTSSSSSMIPNATSNQHLAKTLHNIAKHPGSTLTITSLSPIITERIPSPVGLNTVKLLSVGSKALGVSPKKLMSIAEKLYGGGYISYPRTETTRYDYEMINRTRKTFLNEHANHPEWGNVARYLSHRRHDNDDEYLKRLTRKGYDAGDHPPITPERYATRNELTGIEWRVYEFVVRTFLGSLSDDLVYERRTYEFELGSSSGGGGGSGLDSKKTTVFTFERDVVDVTSLGFGGACPWVLKDIGATSRPQKGRRQTTTPLLSVGTTLPITAATFSSGRTKPPPFLQEHELIELMDVNGIGTDASMATHVSNIVDRKYVILTDEEGDPLRPPLPPHMRRGKQQKRQRGRYVVPTPLGMELIRLFQYDSNDDDDDNDGDFLEALVRPAIRSRMESEMKRIATEGLEKDDVLMTNLEWFEKRYRRLVSRFGVSSLDNQRRRRRQTAVDEFGGGLMNVRDGLRFWRKKGAFEDRSGGDSIGGKGNDRGRGGGSGGGRGRRGGNEGGGGGRRGIKGVLEETRKGQQKKKGLSSSSLSRRQARSGNRKNNNKERVI